MIEPGLLTLFFELIHIEGLSGEELSVAHYIAERLKKLGLEITFESAAQTGGNCGNLRCTYKGGGDIALLAHMDTARSTKGVKPIMHEDRITSDGTTVLGVDDRAGVAAILYSVEKAVSSGMAVKPFTLIFTVQEETTLNGSKFLEIPGHVKMGFIFDSRTRPGTFINSSVGAIAFEVMIKGKAAHSGIAPEKGINALKIAAQALTQIPLGRIDAFTTANIGIMQSGSAVNVVPDFAKLTGEIRGPQSAAVEQLYHEFVKVFTESAAQFGGSCTCSFFWDFSPYLHDENSALYKKTCEILTHVGLTPAPTISWGGSDANVLNERGLPAVNLGVGAENPHSNEEFILLEDLQKSSEIALELIKI